MRKRKAQGLHLSKDSSVFMAGVIEQAMYTLLVVSAAEAKRDKKRTIAPKHISDALQTDKDLQRQLKQEGLLLDSRYIHSTDEQVEWKDKPAAEKKE